MRPSVKSALANAALVLVSLAVTYLAASFVIFRFLLPHLSLNLRPHFPDIAEVFAQTSKAGAVPHDYIAVLGDSYAEGQGDGLFDANGDRAKFEHSAHVLHRLTGRDVVSLGLGGAGSAQAMVRKPARILDGNCFLYPRLDPPRQIVVYFYEGNDLDENGFIATTLAARSAVTREMLARDVAERYAAPPKLRCLTDLGETTFKMAHFVLTNAESFETLRKPSARNKVLAGGAPHAAPALQKPPGRARPARARSRAHGVRRVARMAEAEFPRAGHGRLSAVARRDLSPRRHVGRRLHALAAQRGAGDAGCRHRCREPPRSTPILRARGGSPPRQIFR